MLKLAILASSLVYLAGAAMKLRWVLYVLKPGTMLLIIGLAIGNLRENPSGWAGGLLLLGLGLSLVGDVLLMLPRDLFLPGLVAFLLAHIAYIGAMSAAIARAGSFRFGLGDAVAAIVILLVSGLLFRQLLAGLKVQGADGMAIPVLVYSLAISVMVWTAVASLLQPGAPALRPALLVVGALLFYASDSILAWGRFIRPLPAQELLVMVTYFAAQFSFAQATGPG